MESPVANLPAPTNDFPRAQPAPFFDPPRATGVLHRFWFRFGMAYLVLYNLGGLWIFPGLLQWLALLDGRFWHQAVPWVALHVLRFEKPITIFPNGSGDTTYNYVHIWCLLVTAFVLGSIWTCFDRARRGDPWVGEIVRVIVRYVLGVTLLSYGMSKVLHQQMPAPDGARLVESIGDMSPMGLLWTFVGQSAAYSAFTGLVEVIPGLLLLFRRTATLGAVLAALVMFNVAILNFCFDVPVKIYSTHLCVFSIYLCAPALRALWNVFVLHQPTEPAAWRIRWPYPALKWTALALKLAVVGYVLYQIPYARTQRVLRERRVAAAAKASAVDGLYEVFDYSRDGIVVPASLSEPRRWRYVAINPPYTFAIVAMDGTRIYHRLRIQNEPLRFYLNEGGQNQPKAMLAGTRNPDGSLELAGDFGGRKLAMHLRPANRNFLLMTRGFNWVNEYPFNR